LNCKVIRPTIVETTALGAAYLAGLAVGFWKNIDEIQQQWQSERDFIPKTDPADVKVKMAGWKRAVKATQAFES